MVTIQTAPVAYTKGLKVTVSRPAPLPTAIMLQVQGANQGAVLKLDAVTLCFQSGLLATDMPVWDGNSPLLLYIELLKAAFIACPPVADVYIVQSNYDTIILTTRQHPIREPSVNITGNEFTLSVSHNPLPTDAACIRLIHPVSNQLIGVPIQKPFDAQGDAVIDIGDLLNLQVALPPALTFRRQTNIQLAIFQIYNQSAQYKVLYSNGLSNKYQASDILYAVQGEGVAVPTVLHGYPTLRKIVSEMQPEYTYIFPPVDYPSVIVRVTAWANTGTIYTHYPYLGTSIDLEKFVVYALPCGFAQLGVGEIAIGGRESIVRYDVSFVSTDIYQSNRPQTEICVRRYDVTARRVGEVYICVPNPLGGLECLTLFGARSTKNAFERTEFIDYEGFTRLTSVESKKTHTLKTPLLPTNLAQYYARIIHGEAAWQVEMGAFVPIRFTTKEVVLDSTKPFNYLELEYQTD